MPQWWTRRLGANRNSKCEEPPTVADADREYAAIFAHGNNPCAKEATTLDYEQCIGKEVEFTKNHLNAFLTAVRALLSNEYGATAGIKPAGKVSELDLLDNADRAWREYKKNLCDPEFVGFDGGSGASSAKGECDYRVDRQYARQVADAVLLKTLAK